MIKCKCKECKRVFDDYTAIEKKNVSNSLPSYEKSMEVMCCPYCDYFFMESYSQWSKRMAEPWV